MFTPPSFAFFTNDDHSMSSDSHCEEKCKGEIVR